MFEREWRSFSDVPRWGTLRTIKRQNLAEHSFYVVVYAEQIADFFDLPSALRYSVMFHAIKHDAPEFASGDIPGPWKRLTQDKDTSNIQERRVVRDRFGERYEDKPLSIVSWIVKLADYIDEIAFLGNEFQMGNKNVTGVARNTWTSVEAHLVRGMEDDWGGLFKPERINDLRDKIREAQQRHMYDLSKYLEG